MRKVAIITGASGGIGGEIAKVLSNEYDLALTYNTNKSACDEVIGKLNGGKFLSYHLDLCNEDEMLKVIDKIKNDFGRIDVLINNAGMCDDKLFSDRTKEDFVRSLETNVIGTFLMSKYVGNIMYDSKSGVIINISSTNGINTYYPMCIDYDASKSAINSLTHNLSMQFAPYVRVNAVAPGFIGTKNELDAMDEEFIASEIEKIFVRRVGTPTDVANLVEFLVSNKASFINNEIIRIDGGMYGA